MTNKKIIGYVPDNIDRDKDLFLKVFESGEYIKEISCNLDTSKYFL
jgi:hypothetical protein